MSEKPEEKPEGSGGGAPKAPAPKVDPSPEDANTTPKSTPQQSI